jgi:hypothetical protein
MEQRMAPLFFDDSLPEKQGRDGPAHTGYLQQVQHDHDWRQTE